MSGRLRLIAFVAVSLVACGGGATPSSTAPTSGSAQGPGAMDGKSYDVTLDIPGEKAQKDVLRFESGNFESTECTALGFPKGSSYEAKSEGDAVSFHVMTKHPDGTSVEWTGKAKNEVIEGTAVRTMNGKAANGTFAGTIKK